MTASHVHVRVSRFTGIVILVVTCVVTSVFSTVGMLFLLPYARPEFAMRIPGTASQVPGQELKLPPALPPVASFEDRTISVVKRVQPAVVAIAITATDTSASSRTSKSAASQPVNVGGGSGFFVSRDGLIVTNRHVVDDPEYLGDNPLFEVRTHDGRRLPAKVVATDSMLDLAFLKVEGEAFPHLSFADSDALVPGQTVIAIGNVMDEYFNSVTRGVISGLNRHVIAGEQGDEETIEEAIQTDAAINPGNSGGPLLDLDGNVVGVNTAVSLDGQLIGFAIPSNAIRRDVESVQRVGRVVRPFIGVRYALVTPELVRENQLPVDHGALIMSGLKKGELAVAPGSPADKAGLVENDIILQVNGRDIDEDTSLASLIGRAAVGDSVVLHILHAGQERDVTVVLEEKKD